MRKSFSVLGDSWPEFMGNLLILIILGPLYLIALVLLGLWGLVAFVFRFPKPRDIPTVIQDDNLSPERQLTIYLNRFRREISGLSVKHKDESVYIESEHAIVELWWDDSMVSIQLVGNNKMLDTGMWHTEEEGNIDIFFWFAVAALRNGIVYKKNWIGRNIGWVYSNEMSIWMGVSTESDQHFSSFVKFARRIKA